MGNSSVVQPIDYVGRWRKLIEARSAQGRRLDSQHGRPDHWAGERAARFRRMTARATASDPLFELVRPHLTARTTVLDIGAGAGRHVRALAPLVSSVVAVEPSAAMRAQLSSVIQELALTNVKVVDGGWPHPEVKPADLVICSHVAYFVQEIEPFLRALDRANRGRCLVVLRYVQREAPVLDLFERIWHEPRCPEPSFPDLFGAACQLGIFGNVVNIPFSTSIGFDSLEEAVEMIRADVLNPTGPDVDAKIREYVAERMIQREGRWTYPMPPTLAGVLCWEAKS